MEIGNEAEEKLIFSFEIQNCMENNYYQISVYDDKDNYKTSEILCLNGGENISFRECMEYAFVFEKRQIITLIVTNRTLYDKPNDTVKIISLANIVTSKSGIYNTELRDTYDTETIEITVRKSKENIEKKYLFDYLKSGIKLSCFISFDFSQKNISKIKEDNLSILKNIFQCIEDYTEDQLYYSSGFGAKTKESNNPAFDFDKSKLNSDELIEKYKSHLESKNIIPDKKIELSHLIKKITSDIYNIYEPIKYNVLFALISKDIDKKDKKKLIHQIIASSYLPLSIFIIGVGNENFIESKAILNKINKYSNQGLAKVRDNVIFIKNMSNVTANKTISYCLRELSKQIIQYYIYNKYCPEKDENENKKILEKSVDIFKKVQNENNENNEDNEDNTNSNSNSMTINNNSIETPGNSDNQVTTSNPENINLSSKSDNNKFILKSSDFIPQKNTFSKNSSSKTNSNSLKNSD